MAAPSEVVWSTFAFDPSAQTSPNARIFYAMKFTQISPNVGSVTIPRLFLVNYTDISLHYITLNTGTLTAFPVVASLNRTLYDFPTIGDPFEERADSFSGLQYGFESYKTQIYTFYVEQTSQYEIGCGISMIGTGMIRAVYSNDNFQGQYSISSQYPAGSISDSNLLVPYVFLRPKQLNIS